MEKAYLYTVGAVFCFVAFQAFFFPVKMLEPLEIEIFKISAFAEIRAAYTGLFGTLGILFFRGGSKPELTKVALECAMSVLGLFALGRFYSLVVDGNPNPWSYVIHIFELIGTFSAFLLLKKIKK